MKTWKKWLKRIAATVCAAAMCAAMLPATAFAEEPETKTTLDSMSGVSLESGTPDSSLQGKTISGKNVTLQIGKVETFERLPNMTYSGQVCGHFLMQSIPTYYAVPSDGGYTVTEEGIIGNCSYSLSEQSLSGGMWPGLQFSYEALKPGSTTVTLTYYYNFNEQGGQYSCGTCGTPTRIPPDYNWYRDTVTFTVTVEGEPEPEPQYTITGFTKERVTTAPENGTDDFFHASMLPDGINYDETVNVPADGSVTLLYKLTVKGSNDAFFSIADDGATIVDSNCGANAIDGTIFGDINGDTAIIYVTKTFTAEDVANDQLTNTATISGEAGSVLSEDLDEDGDGKYTVTAITPATAPEGGGGDKTSYPGLTKEVQTGVDADNNPIWDEATSAAAGSSVTFKLESNVPDDLLNYINAETPDDPTIEDSDIEMYAEGDRGSYILTFHDQMDDAFELDPESFVVKIGDTELALEDEYTVAYNVTHDKDSICDFEIAVDLVNLYASGAIDDADISGATPITVTYSATLKDGTTGGTYDNTSWVTYPGDETAKDTASVYVFDLKIFKYDQATATTDAETGKWTATGLKGAEFALYGEDAVDENGDLKADAEPILEGITSGEDGYATITGLAAGNYILTETKAPDNYVGSTEPFNVEISVSTAGTDYLVEVNFANTKIPHTGGTGTMMYTIGGVAIIVLAGVLLVVYRKSRKKQDR